MAIVINGSGTVTGLAVGGLPDGTVDAGTLATDSVVAAKLGTDAVTADALKSDAITGADLPAGSVLQVKIVEDASLLLVSTATYTDTNLSIDITPLSTSSKILAMWNVQGNLSVVSGGWGTRLLRGSTAVFTSTVQYAQYASNVASQRASADYKHLDSPNTTSSITYKVQVGSYQGINCYFNDDNAQTQLVIMEISG